MMSQIPCKQSVRIEMTGWFKHYFPIVGSILTLLLLDLFLLLLLLDLFLLLLLDLQL